jgi:hypothetical protein
MKKILTFTFMAVVAMTIISCNSGSNKGTETQTEEDTVVVSTVNVDSIEHIPLTDGFDRVSEYLFHFDYSGDYYMEPDSKNNMVYIAWNKKDNSIVRVLGGRNLSDKVKKLWIEWENEEVMPKGLKELETVTSFDGKSKFIIGKWKNYFIYSSDGVNFLDTDEPQKIIDDQLWKRTTGR